jgi:hypothetical protein
VTPPTQELDALLEEMEKRERAAFTMVVALCKDRRESGAREWIMSIPARPNYDPDLVIADALKRIPRLTAALREAVKGLEEIAEGGCLYKVPCSEMSAPCFKCVARIRLAAITAKLRGEE